MFVNKHKEGIEIGSHGKEIHLFVPNRYHDIIVLNDIKSLQKMLHFLQQFQQKQFTFLRKRSMS